MKYIAIIWASLRIVYYFWSFLFLSANQQIFQPTKFSWNTKPWGQIANQKFPLHRDPPTSRPSNTHLLYTILLQQKGSPFTWDQPQLSISHSLDVTNHLVPPKPRKIALSQIYHPFPALRIIYQHTIAKYIYSSPKWDLTHHRSSKYRATLSAQSKTFSPLKSLRYHPRREVSRSRPHASDSFFLFIRWQYTFLCLSVCQSVCPSIHPSIHLSIYLFLLVYPCLG